MFAPDRIEEINEMSEMELLSLLDSLREIAWTDEESSIEEIKELLGAPSEWESDY